MEHNSRRGSTRHLQPFGHSIATGTICDRQHDKRGVYTLDTDYMVNMLSTTALAYLLSSNLSLFPSSLSTSIESRLVNVYENVVSISDRPVLALQSMHTSMMGSGIDSILPSFDSPENVTMVFSAQARVPVQHRGLVAVLSVVGVATLCNAVITYLYLAGTRYSRLGNYWYIVAQVASEKTHRTSWIQPCLGLIAMSRSRQEPRSICQNSG